MLDRAIHNEPRSRTHDRQLVLDERSMRVLELLLAGVAIAAVILLTVVR